MKHFALILATLLSLLIPMKSWCGDYFKGMDAYNNGDCATAVKEWTTLAEQGEAIAQFNLGLMYDNGEGVLQDYKTAVKWYTLSVEQGFADAQFNLGLKYHKEQGVPQDYVKAHMWYNITASNGEHAAILNRDIIAKEITPSQIEKTQDLARGCVVKNYQAC